MCHSFCPQEGRLPRQGVCIQGGSASGEVCLVVSAMVGGGRGWVLLRGSLNPGGSTLGEGDLHPEGDWADPLPHQILWDTVNERAGCILVSEVMSLHELNQ